MHLSAAKLVGGTAKRCPWDMLVVAKVMRTGWLFNVCELLVIFFG